MIESRGSWPIVVGATWPVNRASNQVRPPLTRGIALAEPRALARADGQRAGRELGLGEDRLELAVDVIDLDAEPAGDDSHRLREADVAGHGALASPLLEPVRGMADADPAQYRLAEAGEIDDALDDERLDLRDDAAGGQDKRIERESGVQPGTEDRDPAAAGERVEAVGGRRIVRPGICGLLGGRDHVRPRLDSVTDVVCDGREERRGRDRDDVGAPAQRLVALQTAERPEHLHVSAAAQDLRGMGAHLARPVEGDA